jgi:hypothetical protein
MGSLPDMSLGGGVKKTVGIKDVNNRGDAA